MASAYPSHVRPASIPGISAVIEISDTEWALVEDMFDPPGREGKPARYPRRDVVDAILFLARTGCQWRYLPAC